MALWIQLVEAIFKRRRQARQEGLDIWLTGTTPVKSWKDRWKENISEESSRNRGHENDHDTG